MADWEKPDGVEYGFLFEAMSQGIIIQDRNLRVIAANPAASAILGLTHEQVLGKSPQDRTLKLVAEDMTPIDVYEMPSTVASRTGQPVRDAVIGIFAPAEDRFRWVLVSSVPLLNGDKVPPYGTMSTYTNITKQVAAEEALAKTIEKLNQAFASTLATLGFISELRDPYTAGHERRVGQLAGAIAIELGLDKETSDHIGIAGTMHDIGKMYVPSDILSKPGKLTKVEYELVKTHPEYGAEIIIRAKLPWPLDKIVRQHHERLDGSGYPDGLKDKEILLESKVMAVADVVEAMSSHRPYRAALAVDAALDEISTNKGILYDSTIVDACIRLFREQKFEFSTK